MQRRLPVGWWKVPFAVLAVGVLAGVVGAALTVLLHLVQHLSFGYTEKTFLAGVAESPYWRRVLAPATVGVVAGLAWWGIRRRSTPSVGAMLARDDGQPRSEAGGGVRWAAAEATTQIVFVGGGGSVGREGAPRLLAAALGQWLAEKLRLDMAGQRTIIAAASGAGLAAVYNVPLSGVVFVLEVVLARWSVKAALVAAPMSALATVVAWPVVGSGAVFRFPAHVLGVDTPTAWALVAVAAPVSAVVGVAFRAGVRWASRRSRGARATLPLRLALAGAVVGVASCRLPGVPGNGKGILEIAFEQPWTPMLAFAAMLLVKPLATIVCFGAGATGGMLMPSLSTGAALGIVAVYALGEPGLPGAIASGALIGAVAVLAVTQKAPMFAAAMGWELTHAPWPLLPLLVVTTLLAHTLARRMERFAKTRRGDRS